MQIMSLFQARSVPTATIVFGIVSPLFYYTNKFNFNFKLIAFNMKIEKTVKFILNNRIIMPTSHQYIIRCKVKSSSHIYKYNVKS